MLSKNTSVLLWFIMVRIGRMVRPLPSVVAHVDQEDRQALGALLGLLARRGARQQQHQVGMLGAAGPHLLAVHDVGAVVLLHRRGAQRQRVGAAGRLGDAERLQAQLAAGDLGQVAFLLLLAAVPQQRAHDVHLGVAGGAIAAGALDFLQHRRRRRDAEPRAAILLGDQDREPAGLGQRLARTPSDSRARDRACASRRRRTSGRAGGPHRGFRDASARRDFPWRANLVRRLPPRNATAARRSAAPWISARSRRPWPRAAPSRHRRRPPCRRSPASPRGRVPRSGTSRSSPTNRDAQHSQRRHQPVGTPVGDTGDDEVVARRDAGDLARRSARCARSGPAGSLPMPISLPPSPTREPDPGAGQEQVVERRGPRRDVDAAHVARPAVGAAAAALDGDGMADAGARASRRSADRCPAVRRRRPRRRSRRRPPRRRPRARRRRRACRRRCAPARRRPPARPPAAPCRPDRRSRARRPRRAARRSR